MAYSKIDIANLALASLGAAPIKSFDENNKRSRMSQHFYRFTRDFLLNRFDWAFARKIKKLEELEESSYDFDVPLGYKVYQLPSDCLAPRDILPFGSRQKWHVLGDKLITNFLPEIYLQYTKKEIDVALFSEAFVNMLQLGMAVRMAPAITQDKQLAAALLEQFNIEQRMGWQDDANIGEGYKDYDNDPNNDTFVNPDTRYILPESRFLEPE